MTGRKFDSYGSQSPIHSTEFWFVRAFHLSDQPPPSAMRSGGSISGVSEEIAVAAAFDQAGQ